jgi:hypothetical protein
MQMTLLSFLTLCGHSRAVTQWLIQVLSDNRMHFTYSGFCCFCQHCFRYVRETLIFSHSICHLILLLVQLWVLREWHSRLAELELWKFSSL